jgi:hypothetical protein
MTLDATKPTDQEIVAQLPYYIRQHATAINALASPIGIAEISTNTLIISAGTTTLDIDSDLSTVNMELVFLSSLGLSTIARITGGTSGQIKIFIFESNNITFNDGPKTIGQLYLNQLPAFSSFSAQIDDVIALMNVGGNGTTNDGYWKELWRQLSVK